MIRVATFEGPGAAAELREVPTPEIPPQGALIRIGACGVCGTDLHILHGPLAEAAAVAVHARPRARGRHRRAAARS